jgi:hypothetical protein
MSDSFNVIDLFIQPWVKNNFKLFDDDLNKSSVFVKDFIKFVEENNFVELEKLIKDIPSEELHKYVSELKLIQTSYLVEEIEPTMDDMFVNVLLVGVKNDCVKVIDKPSSYQENILVSKKIMSLTKKYVFLISNKDSVEGKIIGKIRDNRLKVDLITTYSPKEKDDFTYYFGEGTSKARVVHTLSADFYSYTFETKHKQYLLLSQTPIETQRITVHGMIANVSDNISVGESFKLPGNLSVIFANYVEEEKREYTADEIRKLVGVPNFEQLRIRVFGAFEHPLWLEKLLFAWLFSFNVDGYPLHLSIIGPPGSGKSESIINPICEVIPDVKTKGGSTFRGLIPSFGGKGLNGFNEGALLQADRICYLDEFLTPVCSTGNNYDEISNLFGKMNSILEWDVGTVSSGNGRQMSVIDPTMQVLACSNFQSGIPDIVKVASRLNNATLSRMFWYVQNQENVDFTKARVDKIMAMSNEERMPKYGKGEIVALYDFFKMESSRCPVDFKWVNEKLVQYESLVPSELKGIYVRYNHHLGCIVDGISKLRWLIGEKKDFLVMDDEDYKQAEEIFSIVIASWNSSDEQLLSLPKNARTKHLHSRERMVYDRISEYGGTNIEELRLLFGNCDAQIEFLLRINLIYLIDGKLYAHWHTIVKDRNLEVTKLGQNNIPQWDN